jgi:hypothetical protein
MTAGSNPPPPERVLQLAYRRRPPTHAAEDHPHEDAWVAFASGELDDAARQRLADHVIVCAPCREVYRAVCVLMDEAPAIDPSSPQPARTSSDARWSRRHMAMAALAAGVVLAVAAAAYMSGLRPRPNPRAADTSIREAQAAPPRVAAERRRLAMIQPEVQVPTDLLVGTRGATDSGTRRFLEGFGAAIVPYRERRFDEAAARLERLAATDGAVAEVWFYLGVSHLFAGRPSEALRAFDHPGVAAAVGDDVLWQRALALDELARTPEADAVLRALCDRDGRYRIQACAALPGNVARAPER